MRYAYRGGERDVLTVDIYLEVGVNVEEQPLVLKAWEREVGRRGDLAVGVDKEPADRSHKHDDRHDNEPWPFPTAPSLQTQTVHLDWLGRSVLYFRVMH